jgi:hypothetical protein
MSASHVTPMNKPVKVTPCSQDYYEWLDGYTGQRADWPENRRREVTIMLEEMLDEDPHSLIRICTEMLERCK